MAKALRVPLDVPDYVNIDQRRAANPDNSAWVAASAGTGKTKVLTDRVLRLLLAGSAHRKFCALPILRLPLLKWLIALAARLASWATMPKEGTKSLTSDFASLGITEPRERDFDRARTLFAAMLDCAGGMKIQTIHSFCQSLLARFPLEASLPPSFAVLDDRAAGELARETFELLLTDTGQQANATFTEALHRLLRQIGGSRLKELLTDEVIKKRQILQKYDRQSYIQQLADDLGIEVNLREEDIVQRAVADIPADALRKLADIAAMKKQKQI